MLILMAILFACSTPQIENTTIEYGSAIFKCEQDPLDDYFRLFKTEPAKRRFDVQSSNWKGYTSTFKIDSDSKLYLTEFKATRGEKDIDISAVVGKDWVLPKRADWYSGDLYLQVGYPDENNAYPITIKLKVKEGVVVDSAVSGVAINKKIQRE